MNRRRFFGALLAIPVLLRTRPLARPLPWTHPSRRAEADKAIRHLVRALETGNYDARPSKLTQGCALQVEDLECTMKYVRFSDRHIKLIKA